MLLIVNAGTNYAGSEILSKIIRKRTAPEMTANKPIEREKPIKEKCS